MLGMPDMMVACNNSSLNQGNISCVVSPQLPDTSGHEPHNEIVNISNASALTMTNGLTLKLDKC